MTAVPGSGAASAPEHSAPAAETHGPVPDHAAPQRQAPAWMHSLYLRLALVLSVLFVLLALALLGILRHYSGIYRDEVTQRANADLAMYIARENRTIGGEIDLAGLTALLPYVMKVNPIAEVYVLDAAGKVLAYSGPPAEMVPIDLAPVRRFLAADQPYPIYGGDPRRPGAMCVFSAAPLGDPAAPSGYVYAVLSIDDVPVMRGTVLPVAALAFGAALIFTLATALLLFRSLTGRLQRLANDVDAFRRAPLAAPLALRPAAAGQDEIARLDAAFHALAQQLAEQLRTLERIDRDRRTALAHASHDLRTPLTALQGYLQTLAMKGDTLSDEQRAHYMGVALRHAERLGRLVDQIFALAKLDDPEAQPQREWFSLGELAGDIAAKHRLRADSAGVALTTDIDPTAPIVLADIAMLERAVENLVDNALKFTPAGGRVELRLQSDGDSVHLIVADTGCGMSAAELPHIFERFYRGEAATAPGLRGNSSGLGLAIVRRVAQLHGGTLEAHSTPGQGTRITLTLPTR